MSFLINRNIIHTAKHTLRLKNIHTVIQNYYYREYNSKNTKKQEI